MFLVNVNKDGIFRERQQHHPIVQEYSQGRLKGGQVCTPFSGILTGENYAKRYTTNLV